MLPCFFFNTLSFNCIYLRKAFLINSVSNYKKLIILPNPTENVQLITMRVQDIVDWPACSYIRGLPKQPEPGIPQVNSRQLQSNVGWANCFQSGCSLRPQPHRPTDQLVTFGYLALHQKPPCYCFGHKQTSCNQRVAKVAACVLKVRGLWLCFELHFSVSLPISEQLESVWIQSDVCHANHGDRDNLLSHWWLTFLYSCGFTNDKIFIYLILIDPL